MKEIIFFSFFFSIFIIRLNAQVNLQTGSAIFNLPMFDWQDDKSRLHSIVSLNYNSGNGLRVNEVASNVGQGWNLIACGVISRMQVGEPDDQLQKDGNNTIEDITKYPAGYIYNTNDIKEKGCPKALTKYPIFGDKNHIYKQHNVVAMDRELDYFSFQFNGKTGLFVLNKNNNTGLLLGDSKMKISFSAPIVNMQYLGQGIRTTISTFTIQDEDGLIYKFGKYEGNIPQGLGLTRVLKTNYCDANLTQSLSQPQFEGGNVYHEGLFDESQIINPCIISTWYLTEIQDPLTGRTVSFTYSVRNIANTAATDISYSQEKDYSIISHKIFKTQTPEISSISYPDQHIVTFNYGNNRIDLQGDKILSSVDVQYLGRYLSRYQLNTSYFIYNRYGIPVTDYEKSAARLCLLSVKKFGVDLKGENSPYIFDYYTGSDIADDFVPPPFFCLRDIWGFYNGSSSTAYDNTSIVTGKPLSQLTIADLNNNDCKGLCFLKNNITGVVLNAKSGYAKNGLLRQIIYPTGGSLTYEYDQNMGIFQNETTPNVVGGVHVSKTKLTDGGYSNGCDNPLITQYNFVLTATGNTSSLWGLERPVNKMVVQNHYAAELRYWYYTFPFGSCGFRFQYPGIISRENQITLDGHQEFMLALSKVLNVVSIVLQIEDVVNVILGPTPMAWAAVIMDIVGGLYTLIATCTNNTSEDYTSTTYYNTDLNSVNPLPAQFKRVEIVPSTGIGKTVEEFTTSDDYPLWLSANPDFTMQQRYAHWAYGLPKVTTTYDENGNMVKQTENKYRFEWDDKFALVKNLNDFSCKCFVQKSSSQRNTDWSNSSFYNGGSSYTTTDLQNQDDKLKVHIYDMVTGRAELYETDERIFSTADPLQKLETATKYYYNLVNYQVSEIITTESNSNETYKHIGYTSDYSGGTIDALKQNNILTLPIETYTGFINTLYSNYKLHETVTEFTTLANGNIQPSRVIEQRFNQPQTSFTFYQGQNNVNNPTYKETQAFTYDAAGNLIGVRDEGNHVVSNIYDYSDKYIIASVINADPNLDRCAYTSFETNGLGGWALTGSANYNSTKSITGTQSFNLSSGTSLKASNLNTGKPYKLSFWATSSGVTVSGNATLINAAPATNGFTYYEYDIAQGTATITVSGTSIVDELRLYPKAARMRTTTYDPLIGKTSECDENNRITYYEYDELGRLRLTKDEGRNIIKMYEYNTVSNKQNGCPGIYYNHLITELFSKNNCQAGYKGNSISYTVPANKYTSLISQWDADQKAETELNTYGQTNANNTINGCSLIYYNHGKSQTFTTQGCAVTATGGTVPYIVPANKYSSIISQDVVDKMEQDEIDANGQAYANSVDHRICTNSNAPNWQADDPAQTRCQKDQFGSQTGHVEVFMTDVNTNSNAWGSTAWKDAGPNESTCPHDEGTFPSINQTGYRTVNGQGVRIYAAGTVVNVTVSLNSSDPQSSLTGYIIGTGGGDVSITGSGNNSQLFIVTAPPEGYISWALTLKGTLGNGGYISSNISFTP
jgi:hypothetical protein